MKLKLQLTAILAAVFVGVVGTSASAAPLVIDDFASHFGEFFIVSAFTPPFLLSGQPVERTGLPVLGGERDWAVNVFGEPTIQTAQIGIGVDIINFPSGRFHVATPADSPGSATTLQYDGNDLDGDSLVNAELLDVALPAGGAIAIDFLWIDVPGSAEGMAVDIQLTSVGGGTASFTGRAPNSVTLQPSPYTLVAPPDLFSQSAAFDASHLSSVTFVLNSDGLVDADFIIDNLHAVPEPSTSTLIVVGLAIVGLRSGRQISRRPF
jgi:hypothetical protein